MGGTSIDDESAMGRQPIDPISAQIAEINSSQMHEREIAFNSSIGTEVEVMAPNLTCTNAIEGPMIMGNESIGSIDGQLNSNHIPTHMAVEFCSLSNVPPTLTSAPTTTPSMSMPPANSSMKISSNYDPPPRVLPKTDRAASKLVNGIQELIQQTSKVKNRPGLPLPAQNLVKTLGPFPGVTGASQAPRSYAAVLNCKPSITQAERSQKKSFAHVLRAPEDSRYRSLVSKEPYIHHGEPAVFFDESDELFLAEAYRFTLVGKFVHRKPSMNEYEVPITPVWVSFPLLPIHFRDKSALFTIAKAIGLPLHIDKATSDLHRPSEARPMVYDKVPDFCFLYRHVGHLDAKCFSCSHSAPPPAAPGIGDLNHRATPVPAKEKGQDKEVVTFPRMRWTPVKRNQMRHDSTSKMIYHSTIQTVTTIAPIFPVTTVTILQLAATHTTPSLYIAPPIIIHIAPHITSSPPSDHSTVAPIRMDTQISPVITLFHQLAVQSLDPISSTLMMISPILVFSHIEVHQQGPYRQSSAHDLAGMTTRTKEDGFVQVGRKRNAKATNTSIPRMFLHVRVEDPRLARPIYLTHVYASCNVTIMRDLWEGLHHISLDMDNPWLVEEDFNVISHDGERTGHNTRDRGTTTFSDMMLDYGLEDAGFLGNRYTWSNSRVRKRLDRWVSDDDLGPRPFRFLNF
ncbi:unnamed protein product [Fraxinus pennsylvanica]|uniref:DUF4283 domain-containing protein n=1 Tax=Fraxinus pennsylvanica TaxID=56036 RepID=A0AAD1Z5A3_9LAMI|nr:unnamed protein product [Fraxinus pennsylvanica]